MCLKLGRATVVAVALPMFFYFQMMSVMKRLKVV